MIKLYFPHEKQPELQKTIQSNTILQTANDNLEKILQQVCQLEEDYLKDPYKDYSSPIVRDIKSTYSITIDLFEYKMQQGFGLLPEEREILQLCQQEVKRPPMLTGILGSIFHAISTLRNVIDEVKEWFGLSSQTDLAGRYIAEAGSVLLPHYSGILEGFFTTIVAFFTPDFVPTIIDIAEGQLSGALWYQTQKPSIDKANAAQMLNFADFGYSGINPQKSAGYVCLAKNDLPSTIRVLYDEGKGLIQASRGLKAWLGKKDNNIVVAFSGTEISNLDMVYADIEQLSAPSQLYLKAAGLLKMLLDRYPNKKFLVTGHSLGGGLTQFALTANTYGNNTRLLGYGFNPAGLSEISLQHLQENRLNIAKNLVEIFMTCYDPVSLFGAKLGCLVTLPKSQHNLHGMKDLYECMAIYLTLMQARAITSLAIKGIDFYESDYIPYLSKICLKACNAEKYWPCFNTNYQSKTIHQEFLSTTVSQGWLEQLQVPNVVSNYSAGIYNKFNGTGHTVANRLLLTAQGNVPTCVKNSMGDVYSTIIYGKYGMGKRDFIKMLQDAYVKSSEIYNESRSTLEVGLAMLRNPFDDELVAWRFIFENVFYIRNLDELLRKYPKAAEELKERLIAFTSSKEDLYYSIYQNREPTLEEKIRMADGLEKLAISYTDDLMQRAVYYHVISNEQKDSFSRSIRYFCEQVKASIRG